MTSTTTVVRVGSHKTQTPGPGQYAIPSSFGKEGIHPSFAPRRDVPVKVESAPYQVLPPTVGEGPKYTFHGRPEEKPPAGSPGPGYVPPKFGSDAPSSTFHGWVKDKKSYESSPGPGAYLVPSTVGSKGKSFTLKARQFPPENGTSVGPGPGKYNPNYSAVMETSKGFAYRPIPQEKSRKKEDPGVPGPGAYPIDRTLASSAMSFHGHQKELKKDTFPGPKYDTRSALGKDVPSYSIRGRIEQNAKPTASAPYQVIPSTVGQGPKWSLGGRPKDLKTETTPGPSYVPPPFGKDSRSSSLYGRRDIQKREPGNIGPGPGAYALPSTVGQGKKYTLKARQFPPGEGGKAEGPGPGKYNPKFMDEPVARTIHSRISDPKDKEPAPRYVEVPSSFGRDAPKFTIGRRETLDLAPGSV